MSKTDMIEALLSTVGGSPAAMETRRRRLQNMTVAGLEREILMRGLADYDEPEDCSDEDDASDELVPVAFLGITRGPLYVD